MDTTIDEITDGIHRISTFFPEVGPSGFGFNQFLIEADEPLLFHTGPRGLFPLVAEAVATVLPPESLRWISFGHLESDESGAMNLWLATAPEARVAFNALGCDVSLDDLCDRPPQPMADGDVLDLGGRRVRFIQTPHVPHGWEAQVLFEETTGTLLCGDLLSQAGPTPPVTGDDVTDAALITEDVFGSTAPSLVVGSTLRRLAELEPRTLAIMHGASFRGDGASVLRRAADAYDARLAAPAGAA